MDVEKDNRRQAKKLRRIAGTCGEQRPTTGMVEIPDDLLELVLLRVRTPASLFRAAATCKLWRRVIAGDGFLHRFRSRHAHGSHLLLGHYSVTTDPRTRAFSTEFVPSLPWPAGQRFSLDFLNPPADRPCSGRVLTDSRGGLLAFVRDNWYAVVCDPRTRQYKELGRFPWRRRRRHIAGGFTYKAEYFYECIGAFLLDAGGGNGMSSFRVLCASLVRDDWSNPVTAEACVFSARDNRWLRPSVISTELWDEMYHRKNMDVYRRFVGRTGGSIFWSAGYDHVLVLDESTLEFSTFTLPPVAPDDDPDAGRAYYDSHNLRVVGGGVGGAVRIVRLVPGVLEALTARRIYGAAGDEWECTVVERSVDPCQVATIDELEAADWSPWMRFVDTTAALALELGPLSPSSTDTTLFSLDVDTMTLQPADKTAAILNAQRVFPYELPWPQTI